MPGMLRTVYGSEMNAGDRKALAELWSVAFGTDRRGLLSTAAYGRDDLHFILFSSEERPASGGFLRPLTVEREGVSRRILGIGGIASLNRGRGTGRLLMERMRDFLDIDGSTALGFCSRSVSPFYEKCGLKIGWDLAGYTCLFGRKVPCDHPFGNEDLIIYNDHSGLTAGLGQEPGSIIRIPFYW